MKKSYNLLSNVKLLVAIIFFLIVAISIPIVTIIILNKSDNISTYSIDGLLAYYGAFLGALATIIAVRITIKSTSKHLKEERRLAVRPYLSTKFIHCTVEEWKDNASIDDVYLFAHTSNDNSPYFSIKQPEFVKYVSLTNEPSQFNLPLYNNKYCFFNLHFQNVGAGNAIETVLKINDVKYENFHVRTNDSWALKIILDAESLENPFELNLEYEYCDVASIAKYTQSEIISFRKTDRDEIQYYKVGEDILSRPIRLV